MKISPPAPGLAVPAAFLGAAVCAYGAFAQPAAFWPGWLAACVFWIGCTIGCLAIGLLHPLTGGRWGWAMGRELHAAVFVMPLIGLASLLLIWGAPSVFPWASDSGRVALNEHQARYLVPDWVLVRLVVSLAIWSGLAMWVVRSFSRAASSAVFVASPRLAAFGMIALWLTATSAVVDGMMSLTPSWSSSLFGMLQIVGFAVGGMSLLILLRLAVGRDTGDDPDQTSITHDLGNLLLAFTMVWAYLAFSQFLIIWAADLPEEVSWYVDRRTPGWMAVSVVLALFHFAVPLVLLLSRDIRRRLQSLALVAVLLLAMRLLDHGWTIFPTLAPTVMTWLFLASSWAALGGIWWWLAGRFWRRLPEVNLASVFSPEECHVSQEPEKVS